jgi:hypothetical protein
MRGIRVHWHRVLVALLAGALALLASKAAEQARRIESLHRQLELRDRAESHITAHDCQHADLDDLEEIFFYRKKWLVRFPDPGDVLCLGRSYGRWRVVESAEAFSMRVELEPVR